MRKYKGDDVRPRFVSLEHELIDAAAFRNLSPNAVWMLIQFRRQWRRSGKHVVTFTLPRERVLFKLGHGALSAAIKELVDGGFLTKIEHGGLYRKAAIYGPSENWRAVSSALERDQAAGRVVRHWNDDGRMSQAWEPVRRRAGGNIGKYNAARKAQKTLVKLSAKLRPVKTLRKSQNKRKT